MIVPHQPPALELQELTFAYPNSSRFTLSRLNRQMPPASVLAVTSLAIAPKEVLCLLGPSGCGKSTLLKCVAGLVRPGAGLIQISGRTVFDQRTNLAPQKRNATLVPQDYALFPHYTVHQNVAFPLSGSWLNRAITRSNLARVDYLLELVGLVDLRHRLPHELSGGQRARVALARALAPNPKLVLLDEPFSALDAQLRSDISWQVREVLKETGIASLLVTHDQNEALALADRVAVMRSGALVQTSTPQDLYEKPVSPWVASFVGDANFISGVISDSYLLTTFGSLLLKNSANDIAPSHSGKLGRVMVRPEQLLMQPCSLENAHARISARAFHGHDCLYELELLSHPETRLRARSFNNQMFEVGESVRLEVTGPVQLFDR